MIVDLGKLAIMEEAIAVTHTSMAAGTYNDNGEWIAGDLTTKPIQAVIQPAMGVKLNDLPQGIRDSAQYFIWSQSKIDLDDAITVNGKTFRVVYVWQRFEGGFYRAAMGLKHEG